jgi:hypothetical protein
MRRLLMLVPVAVGAVTLAGAALVPAGAGIRPGSAPLTIEKEVDGVVPPDTEFTVKVECDNANIFTPNGPPVASATVDFDEKGHPDGSDTLTFTNEGTCTVTETHDGDAEDVSYECEGQFPEVSAPSEGFAGAQQDGVADPCGGVFGPQEKPITVFIEDATQFATVTVTNEFPDPVTPAPAAQALAVSPTFTG